MKEIQSQSEWVGKVLTCPRCLRSFEIEVGDEILPEVLPEYATNGYRCDIKKARRFLLKCGHEFPLDNIKPDKNVVTPKYQVLSEGFPVKEK